MKAAFIVVLTFVILIAVGVGLTANAYSNLETDFRTSSVSPDVDVSLGSISSMLLNIATGNYIGAAIAPLKGVIIEGQIIFQNNSFIPLYLPRMEHAIKLEGQPSENSAPTQAGWLSPHETKLEPFHIEIGKAAIPPIILGALANGGQIRVDVDSSFRIAGFTVHKTSTREASVTQSLSGLPSSEAPQSNVTGFEFSPSTITLGDSAMVQIVLTGGSAGDYTIRFIKDVTLGEDEFASDYVFAHSGATTANHTPFKPASTGTYHMEVYFSGSKIWSQPNDSSRLEVQSNTAPFSVTSYGFSPNSIPLGQTSTGSINLTGGSAGTYTLSLWKDIDLGSDQLVTSYSINHDGTTTSKSFSFAPTSTGLYHIDLNYGWSTVWSQPNDSSRLEIQSNTAPFSVTSYEFSPNSIPLGQTSTGSINLTGGSAGTYTLSLWKDIDFAPDQLVTSYTISHNGATTSRTFQFTPTSKGSYHMDLQYGGSTLWSQPNDSSRLKVN